MFIGTPLPPRYLLKSFRAHFRFNVFWCDHPVFEISVFTKLLPNMAVPFYATNSLQHLPPHFAKPFTLSGILDPNFKINVQLINFRFDNIKGIYHTPASYVDVFFFKSVQDGNSRYSSRVNSYYFHKWFFF